MGERIGDLAFVRSKNAGPFWVTLDVFCHTDAAYEAVAAPDVITPEIVGARYRVPAATVKVFRIPELRVIKVSFPRRVVQGAVAERDMHAGQQHVPLTLIAVDR